MYRILTAEMARQAHAFDVAYSLMLEAAKSRHDDALYRLAIGIASDARAGNSALKAAKLWQQRMPESLEAMRQTLGLELALQRSDDAANTLSQVFQATPLQDLPPLVAQVPAALMRLKDESARIQTAVRGLTAFIDDPRRGAYAHTIMGTVALQNQDPARAWKHAQAALTQQGDNAAAATLAMALLEQGEPQAKAAVQAYLQSPQAAASVRLFYIRYLLQSNWIAPAYQQLQQLTQAHPEQGDAWLLLGSLQLSRRQFDAAKASTQRAASDDARDSLTQRAWMQLAQIAQAQQQWDQARAWLNRITQPADELQWRYQGAALEAAQGRLDAGLAWLREWAAPDDEARLRLIWREVNLMREFGAQARAYDRISQARGDFPDDNDLLYTQAMLAEQLNRLEDMERLLRLHMTRAPQDHQGFNALGYALADRGLRLEEARQLIERARELAPQDPFVADSLGWVMFRQGQFEAAIQTLRAAWESRSDAEIAAHLGEVLWATGQAEAARQAWAQGMALDPVNKTLLQTLKRLGIQL